MMHLELRSISLLLNGRVRTATLMLSDAMAGADAEQDAKSGRQR